MTLRKYTTSEGEIEEAKEQQVKEAAAQVEAIKEEEDDDGSNPGTDPSDDS